MIEMAAFSNLVHIGRYAVKYIDLNEGDHRIIVLPNGNRSYLRLDDVAKDNVVVTVDGETKCLWLNHRAGMDVAEFKLIRVGAEVTRYHLGASKYSDSHIRLKGDARLSVAPAGVGWKLPGKHVFPVPEYQWDKCKVHPYDYDMWLQEVIYGYHLGIDLYAQRGAQVVSASDGEIIAIRHFDPTHQKEDYWGTMLAVSGEDGFVYIYCHMDYFEEGITLGSIIHAGDPIGSVGKMGFESKPIPPHLHFEMLVLENPRNFRFSFDSNGRFLPDDVNGFAVNPRHFLVEWYEKTGRKKNTS